MVANFTYFISTRIVLKVIFAEGTISTPSGESLKLVHLAYLDSNISSMESDVNVNLVKAFKASNKSH